MKWLRRVAAVLGSALTLAVAYAGWMLYGGWPPPDGYEFPRSSLWGGGPTALFDGELVEVNGCIRGGEDGATVVWPPGYSLTLEGGEPVVHGSFRDVGMGERVRMGGGWYDAGPPPTSRDTEGCPPPYFLSTGFVD